MKRICADCGGEIKPGEPFEGLGGGELIHEECMERLLDKPARVEAEGNPGGKEWW